MCIVSFNTQTFSAEVILDFCSKERLKTSDLSAMINNVVSHLHLWCTQILLMGSFYGYIFKICNTVFILLELIIQLNCSKRLASVYWTSSRDVCLISTPNSGKFPGDGTRTNIVPKSRYTCVYFGYTTGLKVKSLTRLLDELSTMIAKRVYTRWQWRRGKVEISTKDTSESNSSRKAGFEKDLQD